MRLIGWILSTLAVMTVVAVIAAIILVQYFSRDLPDYTQLAEYRPAITTRLHSGDGRMLAEYATERRVFVPYAAIPPQAVQAFVAAEDQNFFRHFGLDLRGIVRAALANLRNLGTGRLEGASTITQQVAKNFLLSDDRNLTRKIREALLALRIERAYSKDYILELYLNEIYLGRGSYGIAAASLAYFNTSPEKLTLPEIAYLAALPKAPNNYHPVHRPEAAIARRNYVLGRMLDDGYITEEEAEEARAAPLETSNRPSTDFVGAEYYAEHVRRELVDLYGADPLYQEGLSVRTAVDPATQEIVDQALREGLRAYDRRHGWRGPLARLEDFDDWPGQLAELEVPAGADGWQMAVVLDVHADRATIGMADRRRGQIVFEEVAWARAWRKGQRVGPEPDGVDDVLVLGDVILAEPIGSGPRRLSPAGIADQDANAESDANLPPYGLRQIPEIQGAVVAMDPHTGRVVAMSGGYSADMSEFNRAVQARRQPGSAFKPFVYLTALEMGYTPATILLDIPLAVDLGVGTDMWRPSNYAGDTLGPVPLRVGVERSRNLMTVRLLQEIGLGQVRETAGRFGIYDDMDLLYSMALGAGETTLLRLTTGFAMLANGGRHIDPVFIERIQDRNGRTVRQADPRTCPTCGDMVWEGQATPSLPDPRRRIADPVSCYQIASMLEGVVQRGTARRLAGLGLPLAGKTGTTNEALDAWFIGFSADLAVGVFVGFDQPRPLGPRETGGSVAAPIFGAVMERVYRSREPRPFDVPDGISWVRIDPVSGRPLAAGAEGGFLEAFRTGTEPAPGDPLVFDGRGGTEAGIEAGTGGVY